MKFRLLLLTAGVALLGCFRDELQPLPLSVTITADKVDTAVADSVAFEIKAQGGSLLTLRVDWGDSAILEESLLSSRTAVKRVKHAYSAPGTYDVRAIVNDMHAGQMSTTINIRVR